MLKMFTSGSERLWPRESTYACQKPLVPEATCTMAASSAS